MKLGVMVSIRDFRDLSFPEADFSELLLFNGDLARMDERFIAELAHARPQIAYVHAQEFVHHDGSRRLIDLTSEDEAFRVSCIKTLEDSRALADSLGKVGLVIHPGGIRGSVVDSQSLLQNLERSLSELGPRGLLLENMPWYYWQKGAGRMVSNVGVSIESIARLSDMVDGLVLDTAHGYLSRLESSQDYLHDFMEVLGKKVKHIHLSDARAPDKEGLQIGDGDIDFSFLRGSSLPVMIEVWNGHEQGGAGFREGIRRMRILESKWASPPR
jgi:N-acetylneuraminate synthase